MSGFGGPGAPAKVQKPIPPERGSFPLDHDGECKPLVAEYLRCVRRVAGTNAPECRDLARRYLQCRMDHNLMAPDEMKNLGFQDAMDKSANVSSGSMPGIGSRGGGGR